MSLGKPVFWTMHDMWPITGGCHHSRGCLNFQMECGDCLNYIKNSDTDDLSHRIWLAKKKLYSSSDLQFIAPSKWLYNLASSSSLISTDRLTYLPNPIDTNKFLPGSSTHFRKKNDIPIDKDVILFVAANVSNPYKGFDFFLKALKLVQLKEICLVIVGAIHEDIEINEKIQVVEYGYVNNEDVMIELYQSSDLFVTTSLEENLPNTIIEAMSCGVPAVAFDVGGISDIIDHESNGFLSKVKDSVDIANNINQYFQKADRIEMSRKSRNKIIERFSYEVLSSKFKKLYE